VTPPKSCFSITKDPNEVKLAQKLAAVYGGEEKFEHVARELIENNSRAWVESRSSRFARRLEQYVYPWIGKRRVSQITAPELLSLVRQLEKRGAIETAHRVFALCGQTLRYAAATGRAKRDIIPDLRGALIPAKEKTWPPSSNQKEIGKLLAAIDRYDGFPVTRYALLLAPLVFLRPGELRKDEWQEVGFDEAKWRLPSRRMKMKVKHIVPLSSQALEILSELHKLTGAGQYLFPGARSNSRPMSDAAIINALRRMGYAKEEMTARSFRSMASSLLNEQGYNGDWIERQLAHAERNNVRAAYNYAEYLPERRKMMPEWADYLEGLRIQATLKKIG
jgi:integrase